MRNSNTSHRARGRPKLCWSFKWLIAAVVLAYFVTSANGLSSHQAISEYIRDQWSAGQGFPDGPVYAMAQTPDGYLWIGTEKGLVRFDGLNFSLLRPSDSGIFPAGPILSLAVDGEGNLWVRPRGPKLLRYRDGKFSDVLADQAPGKRNHGDVRRENGEILFRTRQRRCEIGVNLSHSPATELPKLITWRKHGRQVWLGMKDWPLLPRPRTSSAVSTGLPDTKINSVSEARRSVDRHRQRRPLERNGIPACRSVPGA